MNDETEKFNQQDIDQTKGLAILSYLSILFLIPMLVNKDSEFTKFHVNQGLILFLLSLVVAAARVVLHFVPLFGNLISAVLSLLLFVLMILGIINAAQGRAKRLPVIGNMDLYK